MCPCMLYKSYIIFVIKIGKESFDTLMNAKVKDTFLTC